MHAAQPRISVAPMMDWTDRHYRYLARLLSRRIWLYTEMVTTGALLYGDQARHLDFDACEHPLVLQLGGSDPAQLATCARIGQDWGYDEINLNVGCPSDRVQNGQFGACLMLKPALVADCIAAMQAAVEIPVTVKCRLGVDEMDSYPLLVAFIEQVAAAGCRRFILHARKAWLSGLSPRENREIPPLKYDWVLQLKRDFPTLAIEINGGLTDWDQVSGLLDQGLDGAMLGRAAYQSVWLLAEVDARFHGGERPEPRAVAEALLAYAGRQMAQGQPLLRMARHWLGLYQGVPGARAFRRHISEQAPRRNQLAVLAEALALVHPELAAC